MSLSEVMLEIVDQLEKDGDLKGELTSTAEIIVKGYIRQIRTAIKLAGSETKTPQASPFNHAMSANDQHILAIDQARAEFQNARKVSEIEEEISTKMIQLIGAEWTGQLEQDFIEAPNDIKVGDKTVIGGVVFIYKGDGKAHASVIETEKLRRDVSKPVIQVS
jgi:hypothetical protein